MKAMFVKGLFYLLHGLHQLYIILQRVENDRQATDGHDHDRGLVVADQLLTDGQEEAGPHVPRHVGTEQAHPLRGQQPSLHVLCIDLLPQVGQDLLLRALTLPARLPRQVAKPGQDAVSNAGLPNGKP